MIVVVLLTVLVAMWQAREDAMAIAQGEPIDHMSAWVMRASVVVAVSALVATWWMALPMAGLFNIVFRWDLNTRRGLPWDYVSASNYYDRAFIAMAGHDAGRVAYLVEAVVLLVGVVARVIYA